MEERTEKPSRLKLKKARERGEVAQSGELVSALILFSSLVLLWGLASVLDRRLKGVLTTVFGQLNRLQAEEGLQQVVSLVVWPVTVILVGVFLAAVLGFLLQRGWVWKRKKGKKKGGSRVVLTVIKLVVMGLIGYFSVKRMRSSLLFEEIYFLLLKISIALLVIGMGDFIYQKWKFYKEMRMTKQEVKEEQKEEEGNRRKR